MVPGRGFERHARVYRHLTRPARIRVKVNNETEQGDDIGFGATLATRQATTHDLQPGEDVRVRSTCVSENCLDHIVDVADAVMRD